MQQGTYQFFSEFSFIRLHIDLTIDFVVDYSELTLASLDQTLVDLETSVQLKYLFYLN